jgi:flagellar basal-body rod modification protein FlgD
MATVSGIWNHSMAAVNPLNNANPVSNASGSGGSASGEASTISANDFLTLLVTEMKNQDPTANTDPNEYINQLVQVNSLQQLISINQNTSTAPASSSGGSGTSVTGQAVSLATPASANAAKWTSVQMKGAGEIGAISADPNSVPGVHSIRARIAEGNLSVPVAKPAAHRVALALSGRN